MTDHTDPVEFERVVRQLTTPLNGQYPRPWMTDLTSSIDAAQSLWLHVGCRRFGQESSGHSALDRDRLRRPVAFGEFAGEFEQELDVVVIEAGEELAKLGDRPEVRPSGAGPFEFG